MIENQWCSPWQQWESGAFDYICAVGVITVCLVDVWFVSRSKERGKKKNNVRGLIGLDSSFFFDPCGKGFDCWKTQLPPKKTLRGKNTNFYFIFLSFFFHFSCWLPPFLHTFLFWYVLFSFWILLELYTHYYHLFFYKFSNFNK